MRSLRSAVLMVATAAAVLLHAAAADAQSRLQQVLERGVLRVGTTGDFNPMSVRDPATNTYRGYDIDAMTQLAADLGVRVEWVATDWGSFMAGIAADRFDIFSGASLSMARARVAGFSQPYFEAGTVPVIQKAKAAQLATWADLNKAGVTIAVSLGTVFEEQAKAQFPQATIRAVQSPATGFQEVLAGRADATITSNVEAGTLVQRFAQLAVVPGELRYKRPFAYVMRQDDHVWINFVNNWVTLKKIEGFFDQLDAKWMKAN
jgi:cyclohexadienyl dehydratase